MTTATAERSPVVPIKTLLKTYQKFSKLGKTEKDVAEELGMRVDNVHNRINQVFKLAEETGDTVPFERMSKGVERKKTEGRKTNISALLAELTEEE